MTRADWTFMDERRAPRRGPQVEVSPLLLGVREAAMALGISVRTLWTLTKEGRVPCVHIGRRVLYDPEDLATWVETLKKPPESPSQG
jgi:excisionase family DNA binding protein